MKPAIKQLDGEFSEVRDDGTFDMYACVYGNIDRQGDLIEKGAVTNVDQFVQTGWIALNHDQQALPIGSIDSAVQDERGLRVTGTFHSTPKAQEVRTVVKERLGRGKTVSTSIGYQVPVDGERYEKVDGRTIRRINKLAIFEASVVNLPANPEAEVVSAKSLSDLNHEMEGSMSNHRRAIDALKSILGIATKQGRKMSGASLEKFKGFHKAMDGAAEDGMKDCKALGGAIKSIAAKHKAYKEVADEFSKTLKNFEGGQQQPEDDDSDGNVAEDDKLDDEEDARDDDEKDDDEDEDEGKSRKRRKEDDEDEDEDKADDDDEDEPKARKRKEDDDEEDESKRKARKRKRKEGDDDEEEARKAFRLKVLRDSLQARYPNRTG